MKGKQKFGAAFLLGLLLLLVMQAASAEENAQANDTTPAVTELNPETSEPIVDASTMNEIAAMQIAPGAKVRLLQLEKAVLKAILRGEKVIEFISENYPAEDTNELRAIVEELKILKEEIASVQPKANDENTVKQFIDLKNDARSLVKQFRDAASEILKDKNKDGLAEKFKEIDWSEYKKLQEQIVAQIREYNAQRLEEVFSKLETKKSEIIEKVRNGEMTMNQARQELGKILRELTPLQRNKAFFGLKEMNTKLRVFQNAKALAAKERFLERRINRLNNRIGILEKKAKELKIDVNALRNRIMQRISEPRARRFGQHIGSAIRGTPEAGD